MPTEALEEELLRSIEEVDARIRSFRRKVRAVLADMQGDGQPAAAGEPPRADA